MFRDIPLWQSGYMLMCVDGCGL